MADFRLLLADKVIGVHAVYESTACFCRDYLTDMTPEIFISVTSDDIFNERERSRAEREYEGLAPMEFSSEYLETLALYRKIAEELLQCDIALFHGSALMMDGIAYVFTAKSGTGKSTHSSIWRKVFGDRVTIINDDKPLIAFRDGRFYAYGTPWCGKHSLGNNISAPIGAICSLNRAERNSIKPITSAEALPIVLGQIYRPRDPSRLLSTVSFADKITRTVPFYSLGCNMADEAAYVSYGAMKGETQ